MTSFEKYVNHRMLFPNFYTYLLGGHANASEKLDHVRSQILRSKAFDLIDQLKESPIAYATFAELRNPNQSNNSLVPDLWQFWRPQAFVFSRLKWETL